MYITTCYSRCSQYLFCWIKTNATKQYVQQHKYIFSNTINQAHLQYRFNNFLSANTCKDNISPGTFEVRRNDRSACIYPLYNIISWLESFSSFRQLFKIFKYVFIHPCLAKLNIYIFHLYIIITTSIILHIYIPLKEIIRLITYLIIYVIYVRLPVFGVEYIRWL